MSAPFEGLGTFYLGKEVDTDTSDLTDDLVLYDAQDLTTHGFIVGMTGSGKTGLGVSLIEEAALDGIPVIAIDPKGDLGNLALTFPQLAPTDFRPYIDESEATREGVSPDELASQKSALWTKGLGEWGQDGERIQRLRDAATVSIYTPGATAGLQISVLGELAPPDSEPDSDAFGDRIQSTVAGLLSLLNVDADPVNSAEHVFLSQLLDKGWRAGKTFSVKTIIKSLLKPPPEMAEVGVLPLDDFFPEKNRKQLAMKLNGLVASPGFSTWAEGEPLNAGRLLYGDDGKPRVSVLSIGHLSDDERMFFVTRLLGEVVGWMRAQSGTSSLRAILYMDEIFGYLPPQGNPPSKTLLLTLLKQARAFGLGIVLATQNPVDLDYKALSNCGTWFVGRLQTENDKARLLDGLEGAAQGGIDRSDVDRILSGIGKRRFLLHNVHEGAPVLMQTRWAMSYLAGPMSRDQIGELMADQKTAAVPAADAVQDITTATEAVEAAPAPSASSTAATNSRPDLSDVPQVIVEGDAPDVYVPMLLARAEVPYRRSSIDLDHTARYTLLTEVDGAPDWSAADVLADRPDTVSVPEDAATFADVPAALADAKSYPKWEKAFKKWLQSERPLTVLQSKALKTTSSPDEDERSFRIRLGQLAREARDEKKQALKTKYGKKLQALEKRMKQAESAIDREEAQASQRKMDTVVRVGTTLLGAFLGGRRRRSTLSQIGVTARSAGRMSKEASDVKRAEQKLDDLQAEYANLDAELQREMDHIDLAFTPETAELETLEVTPKQTDMHITELALAWVPYRRDADGRMQHA
ncbi:MAG: ATP-binding protein [Rubricoccaceae bacterium]